MAVYTIFYEHPEHGKGRYILTDDITPRAAVEEGKDMLIDKFAADPEDRKERARILDQMSIKVFPGRVSSAPEDARPAASHRPKATA